MRFDQRSLLLFAALTLGTTSATWAQSSAMAMGNDKPLKALFTQADQDADKSLNANEAKAIPALAERFALVDANGDGMVSETEFMAAMTPVKK
ncbi:MAG: EF-hand domain-containing protein [Hydrogenophaga sp.]